MLCSDLLERIKKLSPAISNASPILGHESYILIKKGWGYGFNDLYTTAVKLPGFENESPFIIRGTELINLLSKTDGKADIQWEKAEKSFIIRHGKSKSELFFSDSTQFESYIDSIMGEVEKKKWNTFPAELADGIKACIFPSLVERSELNGVAFSDNVVYTTDGVRLARYTMQDKMKGKFRISKDAAKQLMSYELTGGYCLTDQWFYAQINPELYFASRILNTSNYPFEIAENIINTHLEEKTTVENTFPKALQESIMNAHIFSNKETGYSSIDFKLTKEGFTCDSKNIYGKYTEDFTWLKPFKKFEPIEFTADFEFLAYALALAADFKLVNAGKRLLFQNDSFVCLMSCMIKG